MRVDDALLVCLANHLAGRQGERPTEFRPVDGGATPTPVLHAGSKCSKGDQLDADVVGLPSRVSAFTADWVGHVVPPLTAGAHSQRAQIGRRLHR